MNDGTIVHFGPILSDMITWFLTAFGTALAAGIGALVYKALGYIGIQTGQVLRDQLQAIIVNGMNYAAAKVEAEVKNNPKLDIDVKQKVIADAVAYAQTHGADTIKALGLDPNSGFAVQAIKARITTAVADPTTPTPAVLDNQPLSPK